MKIQPEISPRLVASVSSVYTDINRVVMEYVDNSFDSFTKSDIDLPGHKRKTEYDSKLKITVKIIEKPISERRIEITDNCTGIADISDIIKNIGNSDKKMQSWTNGQFGFGIYSFMAACNKLQIISKTKNNEAKFVKINKEDFLKDKISEIKLEVSKFGGSFPYESGTKIILSEFLQNDWDEININHIVTEIQDHFELLLEEIPNDIYVKKGSRTIKCVPFNYHAFKGEEFKKEFKIIDEITKSEFLNPVRIFLKFTKGQSIQRLPVFVSKKRRVQKVTELKIFDTDNKTKIWKHPLLTGYVDTGGILNPTISRTEYRKDKNAKRLFSMLRSIEDEIIEWVNKNTNENILHNFSHIEDIFNDKVNKISSDTNKKAEIPIDQYNEVKVSSDKYDPLRECVLLFAKENNIIAQTKGDTPGSDNTYNIKDIHKDKSFDLYNNFTTKEINIKRKYANKNIITLKIDGESNPIIGPLGVALRSHRIDNTVIIFKKHSDFERRIKNSQYGNSIVTTELIHYLCLEYLAHIFEYSNDGKKFIKTNEFTDSFYILQQELKGLEGEALSSIY